MTAKRSRAWTFYINIYTDDTIDELNQLITKHNYITHLLVVQKLGPNGSYYLSGYIRFQDPTSLSAVSKKISNAFVFNTNAAPIKNYEQLIENHTPLIIIGDFTNNHILV